MTAAAPVLAQLAGFVAAEGTFVRSGGRFRFAVAVADDDAAGVRLLHDVLGVGTTCTSPPRGSATKPAVIFAVQDRHQLLDVVVPWLESHLAPCAKRDQFERWREALVARGRRTR